MQRLTGASSFVPSTLLRTETGANAVAPSAAQSLINSRGLATPPGHDRALFGGAGAATTPRNSFLHGPQSLTAPPGGASGAVATHYYGTTISTSTICVAT